MRALLCALLVVLSSVTYGRPQPGASLNYARRKVYPALVNITVVSRYFQGGRAQRAPAGGSGVIVSRQGHVLTNYHVAGNTTRILCTLSTGESIPATVIAHDAPTDLSVLKLQLDKRPKRKAPLPFATLGDSDTVHIGEQVIAMGNPLMLSSSLTVGVVSNARRVFTDFTGTQMEEQELDSDERTGMFTRWIQHDALILPGNSGGPLVNLRGQVIGINELGGGGMGFAIPSNTAASVLRQVLATGSVRRGWLGITVLPVSKLGRTTGALVASVDPGSAAEKAHVAPGDILMAIDGMPANVRFFEEVPLLYQRVADLRVGRHVALRYLHVGKVRESVAVVTRMQPTVADEEDERRLGITVRTITEEMALSDRYATRAGVLVTGVRTGYPCDVAVPRIAEGDIITAIGGKPTQNLAALRKAIAAVDSSATPVRFRHLDEDIVTSVKVTPEQGVEEGGELPKAWLGVKVQVVTPEVAAALGSPDAKGFRITEVYPSTEAAKAGLRAGDILTALNGSALEASRPQDGEDLRHAVEELSVGETAKVTVSRGSVKKEIAVKLEATPTSAAQAKKQEQEDFEFVVREITSLDRMERRWKPGQKGILVVDVTSGGWAHMAGLHVDDIILAIQGTRTDTLDAFQTEMKQLHAQRPPVIQIFVQRDFRTHFVFVEPDWSRIPKAR
jgi:S1-C subfamily serine protease